MRYEALMATLGETLGESRKDLKIGRKRQAVRWAFLCYKGLN